MPVTAILKIKTTLPQAAEEAEQVFGEGGNPQATQVEEYIGLVNTPPVNGYVRVLIPEADAQTLEAIGSSPNADLVRVEWNGQEEFDTGNGELLGVICQS